jgi:hypothetical protein
VDDEAGRLTDVGAGVGGAVGENVGVAVGSCHDRSVVVVSRVPRRDSGPRRVAYPRGRCGR